MEYIPAILNGLVVNFVAVSISVYIITVYIFLQGQTQPIQGQEKDIVKGLSNYYYTFVDVMQFKVNENNIKLTNGPVAEICK